MKMEGGPLAYESQRASSPLSLSEEATLAFAACGITGCALAELPYTEGGNIMTHLVGRTVASGDAMHSVSLFVISDDGVHWVKRPQDFAAAEIPEIVNLGRSGRMEEWYARGSVIVGDKRVDVPREVPFVPGFNQWSANVPGSTYFVPVNELSMLYINVVLAAFSEDMAYFILDDRNGFAPAGIGKFARSRGGHLRDDFAGGRVATVSAIETWLCEFAAIEQGGMLQNLGLTAEALGLGGFMQFAAHPWIWMETLGFRMQQIAFSKLAGLGAVRGALVKLLGKDAPIPTPVGLEVGAKALLKPFCPPYYPDMRTAVRAYVEYKFAAGSGTLRNATNTAWKDGGAVQNGIPGYSERTIEAAADYCDYVYRRYGRFPSTTGPFRSVLAYQAHRLDPQFYGKYYKPDGVR